MCWPRSVTLTAGELTCSMSRSRPYKSRSAFMASLKPSVKTVTKVARLERAVSASYY